MSFEQTTIFSNLVNSFYNFACQHQHDAGREQMAASMVERFGRIHGSANIAKVAKKANQKAKVKFFNV